MDDRRMLLLMQLCDSNFPIGNFSHSFGLETYIQAGKVKDKASMSEWLEVYFREQMVRSEGLGCFLAFQALQRKDDRDFQKVGQLLHASSLAREVREANEKMGIRFLRLIQNLYPIEEMDSYGKAIQLKKVPAHPALVFAIIGRHFQLTAKETVVSYLYSAASSLIQNGVRGIPLGQTAGQQLLYTLSGQFEQMADRIAGLTINDLGATPPGLEMAQFQHEKLTVRIFMS